MHTWLILFLAPADYGSDTFGPDGRYTFQTSGGRHSIRIRNVQPVDDGAYQCTLVPQEAYGYVHKKSSLTLAVLGEIYKSYSTRDIMVICIMYSLCI